MTGTLSDLVIEGLAASAAALDSDPELLQTPVDHHERAVLVIAAPELVAVKIDTRHSFAAAERHALRELQAVVSVPEILFATEVELAGGESASVTGLSWVRGDPLDQLRGDQTLLHERWSDAGELLTQIHSHPIGLNDQWPMHLSHPTRRDEWVDAVVAGGEGLLTGPAAAQLELQLEQLLARIESGAASDATDEEQVTLIHGDASTQHVLGSAVALNGLIDLGDVGIGDPTYDFATLTLWFPQRLQEVAGSLSDGAAFEDRVRFHRLMRFASGACWLRDHDFDPAPHLEGLYSELLDTSPT